MRISDWSSDVCSSDLAWSDITVQLKRRLDLIPNLVEAVKGYAKHERGVFEEVTKARANALNAKGVEETAKAENMFEQKLKRLSAVPETYPDLKASDKLQSGNTTCRKRGSQRVEH